ncbi:hypothetical protein C6I20_09645 [Aeromicrobium sp. A1-2]|uniref:hypothetical protein n=1 Tax=Aeromicrobium sp. A1-2 TaxID=2107713 RepID=UPI000E4ADB91|nr:hypothetical protein [Aeromicrobium sp. A1-2]AXT85426.1 hypothetical protein C6I20_09645 [Aeromicrobium sp. A1-2]
MPTSHFGSRTTPQADLADSALHYGNQTPCGNPERTSIGEPPAGYEQIFQETIGRHGSRSQTKDSREKRALKDWQAASQQDALTEIGVRFYDDVLALQEAEERIGYGRLSMVGALEWFGIGRRTAANYQDFWDRTVAAEPHLRLERRTTDSGLVFTSGSTSAGRAAIKRIQRSGAVREAADNVLRRLYSREHVDSLSDALDRALDIYSMYVIAPGMRGETASTFERYVPIADAAVLN